MKKIAISLAVLLSWARPSGAAFQEPLVGPESAALGNASIPGAKDSTAILSNPARLAAVERADFYFMHGQMYAGMEGVGTIGQGFVSSAFPTRWGTLGLGLATFRAQGLLNERTVLVSAAKRFGRLELGVTGKHLHHGYEVGGDPLAANDPVFANGTSKGAFSLDAGAALRVSDALTIGAAVRNLNAPDVGLAVEDRVQREFQTGAAYDFGDKVGLRLTGDLHVRENRTGAEPPVTPSIGLEKRFSEGAKFRFGASSSELTAGFGLQLGSIGLDYAFVLRRRLVEGSLGTHTLGLRVRFGGHSKETVK